MLEKETIYPQEYLFEQEEVDNMPRVESVEELLELFRVEAERLENDPVHQANFLKAEFSCHIQNRLDDLGISKQELAHRLSRSRRHVDRIFSEGISYNLDSMVSICMALGLELTLEVKVKQSKE